MSYGALASTVLVSSGHFEEALKRATAEIAALPDEPEAYFNRAQALVGLQRWDEAVADCEAALQLDASASGLDPAALDDELFSALRHLAVSRKDRPDEALAVLARYRALLPGGRHIGDLATWEDHVRGVETVWYRERA